MTAPAELRPDPGTAAWVVEPGRIDDAEAVLALQRQAYASEAALYDDWAIPPLTQTLAELRGEFATHRILVARSENGLVGSVRGRLVDGTCHVGRLVVAPEHRRRGLGSRLMAAIEAAFPEAVRFELFTGHRSAGNLALYRRLGYEEFRRQAVSPRLTIVFLERGERVGDADGAA